MKNNPYAITNNNKPAHTINVTVPWINGLTTTASNSKKIPANITLLGEILPNLASEKNPGAIRFNLLMFLADTELDSDSLPEPSRSTRSMISSISRMNLSGIGDPCH